MFLGADPTGARSLAADLLAWSRHADALIDQVLLAEALSQVPSGAVGPVDEAQLGLRATAAALETIAHELSSFRLDLGEHDFGSISPVPQGRVFARSVEALLTGTPPGEVAVDRHQLPAGYEEWFDAHAAVVHAHDALQIAQLDGALSHNGLAQNGLAHNGLGALRQDLRDAIAARSATDLDRRMVELGAEPGAVERSLPPAMAALLVGASFDGSTSVGHYLASLRADADLEHVTALVDDPDFALAWFNGLGPDGIVATMHAWASTSPERLETSLPALGDALARASRSGRLGFTGAELVEADLVLLRDPMASPAALPDGSFHVELLLPESGVEAQFLLDVAAASFHRAAIENPLAPAPVSAIDRRVTTMAALVAHDAVVEFVQPLDDDVLASVLTAQLGRSHPLLPRVAGVEPPVAFAASLGSDVALAHRVVDVVAAQASPIVDARLARGLDVTLAINAATFVLSPGASAAFHDVHRQVLARGAGVATILAASSTTVETFTRERLVAGDLQTFADEVDVLGAFVSTIRAQDFAMGRGRDLVEGLNGLSDLAAVGTGAVGVVSDLAGKRAIARSASMAGLLLSFAGLTSRRATPSEQALAALITGGQRIEQALARSVRRGAVATGRVVDGAGRVVTLADLEGVAEGDDDAWLLDGVPFGDWVTGRVEDIDGPFEAVAATYAERYSDEEATRDS